MVVDIALPLASADELSDASVAERSAAPEASASRSDNERPNYLLYVPRRARRAFQTELWASIVVGVMAGSVGPFLTFVASRRLHCSGTLISLMVAAPWVASTLCLVWTAAMEGRSTMRFAANTWILGRSLILLMVFAVNPYVFAAIAIAYSFISMMSSPAYLSIIRSIYPDDHRGRLMSYVRVAMTVVATIVTIPVGNALKRWDEGYRVVFPIAAVFGIISVLIFRKIRIPGETKPRPKSGRIATLSDAARNIVDILRRDKAFAWFILTTTIYGFGNFLAMPAYPKFQDEILKMDEAILAYYTVLSSIVLMFSYLFWGSYIDRKSPIKCTAVTIFINAGLPLVFLLSTSVGRLIPGPPLYIWVIPAFIVSPIMQAGLELAYFNSVIKFAPQGQEMDYQSVHSGVQGLRGIVGPILGGIMYDILKHSGHDVRYVFLVSLILIIVGWTMLVYGKRHLREPASPSPDI